MKVRSFDPLADGQWAEVVRTHPRASAFHTTGWLDALKRTYGYSPIGFTTSAPGEPLTNAVVGCEIRSWLTGRRLVSLPFADHCDPLIDDLVHGDAIAAELQRRVGAGVWRSVECRPLTSGLLSGGSFRGGETFCFHALDLRASTDDLFSGFHTNSIQQTIRRAEREGLQFEAGTSDALIEKFYRLLLLTRRRHQLPPQPIDWFRNLVQCMGAHVRIWLASTNGRPAAAILLLRHRDTLVYKYGASDAAFHNLGAMPFLLWNAIRDAKSSGACTLDLGRSDPDNAGLITFKDRLGGERSTLQYVRCPVRPETAPQARWSARIARQIAAGLPDRVFISTGRLLYRHFG